LPSKKVAAASKRKLHLQFSIQQDDSDNEDNAFRDNPLSSAVLSEDTEDDEDITTSPSLTFGVVDGGGQRQSQDHYRVLQRQTSETITTAQSPSDTTTTTTSKVVGGARKKSRSHSHKKRGTVRRPSATAMAVVAAGAGAALRLDNGEIRPLREICEVGGPAEESGAPAAPNGRGQRKQHLPSESGQGNTYITESRRTEKRRVSRNNAENLDQNSGGYGIIPPGQVGGKSKSADNKDELNHIIPESKKFPQVRKEILL
jgi:hypothetical protein